MAEGKIPPEVKFSGTSNWEQAMLLINGSKTLEYYIEQCLSSGRMETSILLSGKTGAGKSHLVNALTGQKLAKEGYTLDPETFEVTSYHFTVNNVQITVFDTPGLADGTGNEEEYLRKIKESVTDPFDVFIFCTEMNSRRFRNDDIKTVETLTATFGTQLWEHAVVALTFANEVLHPNKDATQEERISLFNERMRCFKKTIQDVLLKVGVAGKVVINVPFVATGDLCEPCLPGITNWQTAFWIATFKRLDKSARFPFLILNKDRLKISSAEPDVQAKERPLGRSLPPQEAEGTPQRRQRRSFCGFELVNREQDSGYEPDSDAETEFRTKSRSLPVKTSKIPPKTKPKPKKEKKQQDTSTIDIDEGAASEVVLGLISEVGEEASKLAGEYIHPGAGDVFQNVFRWIMRLLKFLWQRRSSKEDARDEDEDEGEDEDEVDQGDDSLS